MLFPKQLVNAMTHTDHLHGSLICRGASCSVWLERSAWDFSHATRITLHKQPTQISKRKVGSVLRVDENDTLHRVLSTLVIDNDAPVSETLNLGTDHAHRSTEILASEHTESRSLIDRIAIAQIGSDTISLRSLGTVVLSIEGVLEHKASIKSGETVLVVTNRDICCSMSPVVGAVTATAIGTRTGVAIAHFYISKIRRVQERVGYATCRGLPTVHRTSITLYRPVSRLTKTNF
jgi:hypothetical protein